MARKSSQKGSGFERWVCKTLSLWWTEGKDDSVFYRSHGSGARATARSRKGKDTPNSHGDILALDPLGQPLLDLLCFELKRGYNRATLQDVLDRPSGRTSEWEAWIEQATESSEGAGSYSWALVVKRDTRQPLIAMPVHVAREFPVVWTQITLHCDSGTVMVTRLDFFLAAVAPHRISNLLKRV